MIIRVVEESAGRALREMGDGFVVVDADWRITYINAAAERIIGAPREPVGRPLWDIPWFACDPALENDLRRVAAEGVPAERVVKCPYDQDWHRVRLAPLPDGLTIYLTGVAEPRAAAEWATAQRSARVEELTIALADALTARDVIEVTRDRVLPAFGATGLIVAFPEGEHLHIAHVVGYSDRFFGTLPRMTLSDEVPLVQAVRDRVATFIENKERFEELYPMLTGVPERGHRQAWAFLPLIASGQAIGSCMLSFEKPHRFSAEERGLLIAVSGLLAQALERARLFDAEHDRARQLQRGLLPRRLPRLPAAVAAARYLPAAKEMEVGGDWYDVIPLSAERVALVIGDVMGHGVPEAVTMGRVRTAVRTLADLELSPDELLAHLNDLVNDFGDEFFVTCLYMVYDPVGRECVFARAGHPPPAVVTPDGAVRFAEGTPDPPLGAAVPPFDTVTMTLPEGSLLVLYTDGLVESATLESDQGMAELADALAAAVAPRAHPPEPGHPPDGPRYPDLEVLCDTLTSTLLPARQPTTDDIALLVVRPGVLDGDHVATWDLPEEPTAAGLARHRVRARLAAWGLEELTMTTELLVSELVGNVVRHARGPIRLRLLRGRVLTCEVSDGSLTTPRIRRPAVTDEGGRGLQLVAALAHRWGTRYTADGKCIWTEQLLYPDR
ncbi:SpoIIE family protein phosphatase [Thermopolyspora sp. NPDC052614]|uniref:ATP-binding SpoIIE family protein phosphatase n=1 Tax=Thermopolyspora sp. NPDC052614 TaxID=3155682 RepID=UPI00342E9BC4